MILRETAELQFGLNQCLIRVGIYPQLQSVLQTSYSDCPINDVWPQRRVDIHSKICCNRLEKTTLPFRPPFPKGPFIIEVRKYLSRLLLNQINPKLRTKSFRKKSLE